MGGWSIQGAEVADDIYGALFRSCWNGAMQSGNLSGGQQRNWLMAALADRSCLCDEPR